MSTTVTAPSTASARCSRWPKWALWSFMGTLSIFIICRFEIPMFRSADEQELMRSTLMWLLAPHILAGTIAFVVGPLQFSDRLRLARPKLHRRLGYIYSYSVFIAALLALILANLRHLPHQKLYYLWMVSVQGSAWLITTAAAMLTARNGYIQLHRQWAFRSYAVTFTFIGTRTHQIIPRLKLIPPPVMALDVVTLTLLAIIVADLLSQRKMLFQQRLPRARVNPPLYLSTDGTSSV